MKLLLTGFALASLLAAVSVGQAQFARPGSSLSLEYSFAGTSDVSRWVKLGKVDARYVDLDYSHGWKSGENLTLSLGVAYSVCDFGLKGTLPLPDKLQETALTLGLSHQVDSNWSLFLRASPGYRSAGSGMDSEAFSVPVGLGASYASSRTLHLSFGLFYNEQSEYPLLPFLSVNWKFAPKWSLSTGFPKTGLSYEVSDDLSLFLRFSMKGGSYWVKNTPSFATIALVGVPSLGGYRNTTVDFRELRVGLGFEYKLADFAQLTVEAGAVPDRRFDFHKLNESYDGSASTFASASLRWSF